MEREEKQQNEAQVKESGQMLLEKNQDRHKIYLLSIIGEIEGHEAAFRADKNNEV